MTDIRFQYVDDTNISDHARLTADDKCLYLREYTAHKNYSFSETNSLISNLKKRRGIGGFQYKAPAIAQCAQEVAAGLNKAWFPQAILVPVPGSKILGDPEYDDRMERICSSLSAYADCPVDWRPIVRQTASTRRAHEGNRLTVQELLDVYEIDESKCDRVPSSFGIIDDVLTAGTHYRAMHTTIRSRFPNVDIYGIFIARRVFANDFLDDAFL